MTPPPGQASPWDDDAFIPRSRATSAKGMSPVMALTIASAVSPRRGSKNDTIASSVATPGVVQDRMTSFRPEMLEVKGTAMNGQTGNFAT